MDIKRSLSADIKLWVAENPGRKFSTNVIDSEVGVYTSTDKNNRWHILRRLMEEKQVEKYGGAWRVIYNGADTIDYLGADEKDILNLKWTFGLEKYVVMMPKNIAIIAGAKDAGKTAFLLNFIRMNMPEHFIHYWSSEMGALELKRRLIKFEENKLACLEEWAFDARERAFDFQDVVAQFPDDIHIIDFLEIHDEFQAIAKPVFEIYNKLKKGLVIIALQKNPGVKLARGGTGTLEKARLYVSLDKGLAEIVVGKNWADQTVNPVGKKWSFQLVGGCKFVNVKESYGEQSQW